ncbi:NUDIX hydrolase [Nocardioides jiangxiensis]|uniref:NUDIX domain-containing protein n=1 Tax=Nocardioides jiangxiensis TaxID=3064524 RepID=A0ABT9AZY1_9ACTN|nr:NUDIX domain-containing protein [Nocardioides sp. WY-20]MDO7868145.1 NUDIX domain-containing protein [Nocardioides sp. WY-20]
MSDQHPDAYDASTYPSVFVTVDLAVFTIRNGALSVLLIERGDEPYAGRWALPGGFINPDEDAEQAAWRELAEETGVEQWAGHLEQLKTYSAPDRDPRHRIVSVAHVAFAPNLPAPVAGDDARNARWWAVDDVVGGEDAPELAFDHAEILDDAIERVRSKLEYTTLATEFVEEPFTLAELHRVYAAVWGRPPSLGAFRRKVISTKGFVEATSTKGGTQAVGRPATLYRRGGAAILQPAMLRQHATEPGAGD